MAFALSERMLGNIGKVADSASKLEASEGFRLEYIPLDQIHRSEQNFFGLREIEELADSIEQNGLQHNIVVRKLNGGGYELISGERRYGAYQLLYERYGDRYKHIPAKVTRSDDVDAEISLIHANTEVRKLTPAEQLRSVERLKELYELKRQRGEKISGRLRERLATDLKLSIGQVGNLENISANLDEENKERFLKGEISVPEALSRIKEKSVTELSPQPKTKKFARYKFPFATIDQYFSGKSQKEIEKMLNDILVEHFSRSRENQ